MKKKKWIGIVIILVVLVVVIGLIANRTRKSEVMDVSDQTNESVQDDISADEIEDLTELEETESNEDDLVDGVQNSDDSVNIVQGFDGFDTVTDSEEQISGEEQGMHFPYTIPNTNLVVRNIAPYNGLYIEDGNDSDISNVSMLVLENQGSLDVEYAKVTVVGEEETYTFVATDLLAGAVMAIQESGKQTFKEERYSSCSVEMTDEAALSQDTKSISVAESDDGGLMVTNISKADIPCVRVFYKYYMAEEDAYIGGITYTAKLEDLPAGESQTIYPTHYMTGYSKVVRVCAYDSKE